VARYQKVKSDDDPPSDPRLQGALSRSAGSGSSSAAGVDTAKARSWQDRVMCVLGTLTPAYLLDKLDRIFTPTSTASIAFALAVLFGFLQSLVFAHFTHGIISRYFSEDAPDAATDFKIHKVFTYDHAANATLASLLVSVPLCPCGLSVVPAPLTSYLLSVVSVLCSGRILLVRSGGGDRVQPCVVGISRDAVCRSSLADGCCQ